MNIHTYTSFTLRTSVYELYGLEKRMEYFEVEEEVRKAS